MGTWARNSTWKYIKIGKEADDLPATPPSGKITITENGNDIDVSTYATADVAVEGGGSSDFSTAEVTVVNNENNAKYIDIVIIEEDNGDEFLNTSIYAPALETVVSTVVLYKGVAYGKYDGNNVTVTGDIETTPTMLGTTDITVTGNGTITITI